MIFNFYRCCLYFFISGFCFSTLPLSSLSPESQIYQAQHLLKQRETLSLGWFKGNNSEQIESVEDLEHEFLFIEKKKNQNSSSFEKTPLLSSLKEKSYGAITPSPVEDFSEQIHLFQSLLRHLLKKIVSIFNLIEDKNTENQENWNQFVETEQQYDDESIKKLLQNNFN